MKKFLFVILQIVLMSSVQSKTLPDFELPIHNENKTFKLSEQKGKTVVINVWATWCVSCIKEIPELNELKNKYSDPKYTFVAISAGDTGMQIKKFLSKHPFNFVILEDSTKNISKSLGVTDLPRTIVVSPSGEVLYSDSKPPKNLN